MREGVVFGSTEVCYANHEISRVVLYGVDGNVLRDRGVKGFNLEYFDFLRLKDVKVGGLISRPGEVSLDNIRDFALKNGASVVMREIPEKRCGLGETLRFLKPKEGANKKVSEKVLSFYEGVRAGL